MTTGNHLDKCTKPAEPILNHIETYAIDTHERGEQNQQNLEVVSYRPPHQEHH
jgi:hypothetical protein